MSLNLTPIEAETHEEWLPGLDVRLYEADRELTSSQGTSRFVVVVTGHDMTWAGLANEDTMPVGGFDGSPEVVLLEENADAAIRELEAAVWS